MMRALRRALYSRCGWRFTVYGLLLLISGLAAGYALGYKHGFESAMVTIGG
ncbi:hypothetical protein [Aeropyrum camini]|uniref:ABC-type sugar transport system permease protein n=1 Tax=Aeropyrum camini SY1 = JCM 12091 TaxID=1198449 RepID=U3TD03_9CREN|nr:hypothetical protein [Aeropyrum camini]BAN89910.1 ABC-type sugar transport system permease protein [Aeropyrum camini SY1 = JCM 12091]